MNKDLAEQLKKLGKDAESRAMLIARDQSSKLNAALTRARHEEVGVKKYMWSTSGDERVRASHAEKDGQIFEYANPPADTGHPGHDVNCRCVQIPVLDDIVKPESSEDEKEPLVQKSGKMELSDLIDSSSGRGGNKLYSDIGSVSSELVAKAKESIGLDISDWQHSVDESGIRHTFKQHGNETTESKRGQRAVTKKDILLLPLIISSFDSIEYAGLSDMGNETFLIKKEIEDEIFTVQEVRKKHKKLTMKTMWIRRKSKK
ncbi:phage Mu protein gp30-like protein [Haemophilus parainfluenzae]|uniref:Phage Mu protein gp30-like protein n=1 Tax=Haemophilus parainfluenzae TaxID=729 RepID=A0A377JMR5_HAEPA|nr:phage minor head protein [Haemophilus parainfluenzae]STP06298.1 phage Mu protein gp30-like protein [Haemophilus parainfluenzae]